LTRIRRWKTKRRKSTNVIIYFILIVVYFILKYHILKIIMYYILNYYINLLRQFNLGVCTEAHHGRTDAPEKKKRKHGRESGPYYEYHFQRPLLCRPSRLRSSLIRQYKFPGTKARNKHRGRDRERGREPGGREIMRA
jgi:hypothetical protein